MRWRAWCWLGAILWAGFAQAGEVTLKPFDAQSPAAIRSAHAGKPFVLVLWSLHCAPCREEMPHWVALKRRHPQLPILLVAADGPEDEAGVRTLLARTPHAGIETWTFADEYVERVRYAIDREWRGELPRAYFFDAAHRAEARSGKIDPAWAQAWAARVKRDPH